MNPTPGIQTTEFWATAVIALINQIVVLLTVFGAIHWSDPQKAAVVAVCETVTALGVAVYAVVRGQVKAANVTAAASVKAAAAAAPKTP